MLQSKTIDSNGDVIAETKTTSPLLYRNATLKILDSAGINNWCKLSTHIVVYENAGKQFAIQAVKDLGIFLEYEAEDLPEIAGDPYQVIADIKYILSQTGLKLGNDYNEKKVYRKFLAEHKR